ECEWLSQRAVAAARSARDRPAEGRALNNLGVVYRHQGRWAEAEEAYQQDLAICRQSGDRVGEGQTLNNLGGVYRPQGRWAEAEEAYQQGRAICREFGDRVVEGKTLENLALLREAQGDLPAALAQEGEALRVIETTEDEAAKKKARDLIAQWD